VTRGKMPFIAKSAAPVVPTPAARHWTFDRAALGGLTSFVAPPGYLLTEGVFEALRRQGRLVVWARLGPEDHNPATFLESLLAAARRHHPELRPAATAGGWPARFGRLGAALAEAAPAATALAVEHAHHLAGSAALLGPLLEPLLQAGRPCILTGEAASPAGALPAGEARVAADDLRLDPMAAAELLGREAPRLPAAAARQAAMLCHGAAAELAAVCQAVAALGPAPVELAVGRATGVEELLADLAADLLDRAGPESRRALALALEVGYCHPALSAAVLGAAAEPAAGPWLQPLADGWSALRGGWRGRLRAALGPAPLDPRTVHRAADVLADRGAVERAAPLYLRLEDRACAAEAGAGRTALALLEPEPPEPAPPGSASRRPRRRSASTCSAGSGWSWTASRWRTGRAAAGGAVQLPGHPPRPVAAAGDADGGVLAAVGAGGGPQQPQRGHPRAAARLPGQRRRPGGGPGGRCWPGSSCCSTTWTCWTASAASTSAGTSTAPAWPSAGCWSSAIPAGSPPIAG
jgi:hypothetical protein